MAGRYTVVGFPYIRRTPILPLRSDGLQQQRNDSFTRAKANSHRGRPPRGTRGPPLAHRPRSRLQGRGRSGGWERGRAQGARAPPRRDHARQLDARHDRPRGRSDAPRQPPADQDRLPHAGPRYSRSRPRNGSGRRVTSLRVAAEAAVVRQLPRRFCELRAVTLVEFGRASATLAMADPLDQATEHETRDMLGGVELKIVTATLTEVRDAIHHAHAPALVPLVAVPPLQKKRSRRPLALAAALAAAFLLVATTTGVVLTQPTVVAARANLTIFQGSVDVRHGSGGYEAASTSDLVQQGDTIRTASGAHAALTFFDRSVVVLEPSTEVVVETLRTVSGGRDIDLVLRQLTGGTWNVVAHSIGDDGRFEVVTPTSTNTVHGTAFQVRVDEQGRTTVSTAEGTVRTFGLNTAVPPVLVSAGMQSTVNETGPSAAQPISESTLTFTFGDAGQAF